MKKIFALLMLAPCVGSYSQNVDLGTGANLVGHGNLVIDQPFSKAATAPSVAQTKTMINGGTITFAITDSTGRIFDPGGSAANYGNNQNATAVITAYNQDGYELTFEDVDLRAGDSLIITTSTFDDPPQALILLAIGNGYNTKGTFEFENMSGYSNIVFTFKSNSATVGRGFRILWSRTYKRSPALPSSIDYSSQALVYFVGSGSLRTGFTTTAPLGQWSSALGYKNTATGYSAVAAGYFCNATGDEAVALGASNDATNVGTVSLGFDSRATGIVSIAIGDNTLSEGYFSLATGGSTQASGDYSSTFGQGTLSLSYDCMSLGQYNYTTPTSGTSWVSTDPIMIVGNGTNPFNRSNLLEFYKNGNFVLFGTYYSFSDERLKRDFKPLTNSLRKLDSINGYNYYWKAKNMDPGMQTGLKAQEVQKAFPELVTKSMKGDLAVDYNGMIPHLIEAIKELRKEVEQLKSEKSNDLAICICENSGGNKIAAYPNPAKQNLTVTLNVEKGGNGYLQLMDANGRLVKQMNISLKEGVNTVQLSIPQLASGHYELIADWGNGMRKQIAIEKQ